MAAAARGTSKVFPSGLTSADPMTFMKSTSPRGVSCVVKMKRPDYLSQSLNFEAKKLNGQARDFYLRAQKNGKTISE